MSYQFDERQREYLKEIRALETDRDGTEVLVGLTAEETDFYMRYVNARRLGRDNSSLVEHGRKYLALRERHERARMQVLGAEIALRHLREQGGLSQ